MGKKITLGEVARIAGVSLATASRVANRSEGVSSELQERVRKSAAKLGFELEPKNHSKIVAFLLSNRNVLHPFHSAVLMAAEAYCAEHEYGVLFIPLRYSSKLHWQELPLPPILQSPDLFRAAIVAGTNSQNLLDLLSHWGRPFVVLGNNMMGDWKKEGCSAVYFDDVGGAYEVTRHLQRLGHRKIWFIGNCRFPWFARRYEGYLHAMQEAKLASLVSDVDSENEEDIGFLGAKSILRGGKAVSAIFAGGDAAARGAYKAIQDGGLRVGEDISVAGFNDTPEASALHPPLTSVRSFPELVGKQLAEVVIQQITRSRLKPEILTIPTQLVRRESCQPLARAKGSRSDGQHEAGSAGRPRPSAGND